MLARLVTAIVLAACTVPGASVSFAAPRLDARQQQLLVTHVRPGYPFPTPNRWTTLAKADAVLPLHEGRLPESFRWTVEAASLTVADYLERQPVTGLLIANDGVVLFEHYQYNGSPASLFLSNSMAKSVTAIGFALLRRDGLLASFDLPAEKVLPGLADSHLGQVSVRNLLRMSAGLRFVETYQPGDDHDRFLKAIRAQGLRGALDQVRNNEQVDAQGTRFKYGGYQTATLSLIAQQLTGKNLARYIEQGLWQPLGMEGIAAWNEDRDGVTLAQGGLLARGRDWLRLGVVLANGGKRPDSGAQVIPAGFVEETIDAARLDPAFRPRPGAWGYENQFWIGGRPTREYGLLGIHGQSVFISQKLNLVMAHFAVNPAASLAGTSLAREREALWRALVRHYDR